MYMNGYPDRVLYACIKFFKERFVLCLPCGGYVLKYTSSVGMNVFKQVTLNTRKKILV